MNEFIRPEVTDPVLAPPQPREERFTPRIEQMLDEVSTGLQKAVQRQHSDRDPDHGDLYTWGWGLTELLDRIDQVAGVLTRQVGTYAERADLRDDAGWDPATRLATAGDELDRVREALSPAREAIRKFHSAIGHVGLDLDTESDTEVTGGGA